MIPVQIVFEDMVSETVIEKLLAYFKKYTITASYNKHGFGGIKRNIQSYNEASKYTPFFVLTDLDQTECAPILIKEWIRFSKHQNLIFRVAVKEVESWLLADREGFASYAAVAMKRLPDNPDVIDDPKAFLFDIIKKSRKRSQKEDILPRYEGDRIGPNYNGRLSEFVVDSWDIERAVRYSPSLQRAYNHLKTFTAS